LFHTHTHTHTHTVVPTITIPPENTAVRAGQRAQFRCFATGIPQPSIQWFHMGREVGMRSTLVVNQVDEGDQGNYTCRGTNRAGVVMATANLTMYGKLLAEIQVHTCNQCGIYWDFNPS